MLTYSRIVVIERGSGMQTKLQLSRRLIVIAVTAALTAGAGAASAQEVTQGDYGAFIETSQGPEFRLDFVMDRMRDGQPISEASVDALRTIAEGGLAEYGDMVGREEAAELSVLLEAYGLDDIARDLRRSFGVSDSLLASRSAGGSQGGSNIEDWGAGNTGEHSDPLGVTVRDEGGYMVVEDPPGGSTLRNMTMNCLYRASKPGHVQRPTGRYVQELTPPSPINAKRLVDRMRDGTKIEETYEVQSIVFDAQPGSVTANTFRAYFYGRKILEGYEERYSQPGSDAGYGYRAGERRVQEDPAWHDITCRTIHARP